VSNMLMVAMPGFEAPSKFSLSGSAPVKTISSTTRARPSVVGWYPSQGEYPASEKKEM
jgi:hypothetical protein